MLTIIIPALEGWDEQKEEFVILKKEQKLVLEHSLVSLSKWESKWKKPFLIKDEKTIEESIDYIRCMTITQNVDPSVYNRLSTEQISQIYNYIEDTMTATWFRDDYENKKGNSEIITSEKIYYWMVTLHIPSKYEKWHLNRLITLIRVCEEENKPKKKTSRSELIARRRAENEARKKKWNTRG